MSSQDRLENVLRDIHVMISKSEVYDTDKIIVSKNDLFHLIDRLNASIYEIMDEYELTQQSRDHALREHKKEGDKIIWDASRQAEDIYAASVLYTDEALNHLNRIVEEANITISQLYREFGKSMKQQQETIRENQSELKSQLQLLSDTEKYLNLIEIRNREIEREEAEKKGKKIAKKAEKTPLIKPEIKINEEYFRKAGIPLEDYMETKSETKSEPDSEEEMEPLEDEGVIASTLKKVAIEVKNEVKKEANKEEKNEEKTETDPPSSTDPHISIPNHRDTDIDLDIIQEAVKIQENASYEAETLQSDARRNSEEVETKTALLQNASIRENSEALQNQIEKNQIEQSQIEQSQIEQKQDVADQQEHFLHQDVRGERVQDVKDEIKVNLDAEYFKWKQASETMETEEHAGHREKTSFFDKLMGKKKSYD